MIIGADGHKKLPQAFYEGTDVCSIAKGLLGKLICSQADGALTTGIIVETEAYKAPEDRASHAYDNRRTPRTETMFGPPATAYVYLCYGIHNLFNIITGPVDVPHAVLIRAIQPVTGIEHMLVRRGLKRADRRLTGGPGSLSKALGITLQHNNTDLLAEDSEIWVEDIAFDRSEIIASRRVGVESAGESAALPWRYRIRDSAWTSPAK